MANVTITPSDTWHDTVTAPGLGDSGWGTTQNTYTFQELADNTLYLKNNKLDTNITSLTQGTTIFTSDVTGDTQKRFSINSEGILSWSSGSAAADTNLYRSAANTLKTDDAFIADSGITTTTIAASGAITSTAAVATPLDISASLNGSMAISLTNTSTAAGARVFFMAGNDTNSKAILAHWGSGYTTPILGIAAGSYGGLVDNADADFAGWLIGCRSAKPIIFGTNDTEVARFDTSGNFQVNKRLTAAGIDLTPGLTWATRTSADDKNWYSVCYGNGLFVAVAGTGITGNQIMTSPDGINWTMRTSPAYNNWSSVCYGNGLFVAVASTGTGNRVMTSPDGINWTIRTSAADNQWGSVCYGNGLFVAVASTGTGNRVMTSPDGINWTIRTSAADNYWGSVCYGNGLFVAVAVTGTGNRVMTSPDGVTWTIGTSAADNLWTYVCYSNGLFVAVAGSGTGNRVMTSPDGINWTIRTSAADNFWRGVCCGNGLFVAVANSGTGDRVMTSPDGITWTIRTSAADNYWGSVCYGNGLFVAVAYSGTGNRVMTSGQSITSDQPYDYYTFLGDISAYGSFISTRSLSTDNVLTADVSGDTQKRFILEASGKMSWGSGSAAADTNLYRSAANTLKTDDAFIADGGITTTTIATSGGITSTRSSSTDNVLVSKVSGDTFDRFKLEVGGKIIWGSGSAAGDTNLYRSSAGVLKTDEDFIVGDDLSVTDNASVGDLLSTVRFVVGGTTTTTSSDFVVRGPASANVTTTVQVGFYVSSYQGNTAATTSVRGVQISTVGPDFGTPTALTSQHGIHLVDATDGTNCTTIYNSGVVVRRRAIGTTSNVGFVYGVESSVAAGEWCFYDEVGASASFGGNVITRAGSFQSTGLGVNDAAVIMSASGDTSARLQIRAGGLLNWGSGSAAGDTNLYRSAADTLKTDDAFVADGGITTTTLDASGAITSTAAGVGISQAASNNGAVMHRIDNTSNGASAYAAIDVRNDTDCQVWLQTFGSGYTASSIAGITPASYSALVTYNAANNGLLIGNYAADKPIIFFTNNAEIARFDTSGNFQLASDKTFSLSGKVMVAATNPKTWASGYVPIEFGSRCSITMSNGTGSYYTNNGYFDGLNWRRIVASGASRLSLGDNSVVLQAAVSGTANSVITFLNVLNATTTLAVFEVPTQNTAAATSTETWKVRVSGDLQNRFAVMGSGELRWGSGSAAGDTNLYRSAANVLRTDDTFQADGGITTTTIAASGAITSTKSGTGYNQTVTYAGLADCLIYNQSADAAAYCGFRVRNDEYVQLQVLAFSSAYSTTVAGLSVDSWVGVYSTDADCNGMLIGNVTANAPVVVVTNGAEEMRITENLVTIASGTVLKLGCTYAAGAPTATGYLTVTDAAGNSYKIPAVAV